MLTRSHIEINLNCVNDVSFSLTQISCEAAILLLLDNGFVVDELLLGDLARPYGS